MSEKIFREKSLNKVKSPENLDDYIRVANPGVWLLLLSVIVLLAGACVWGIFGHIDSTVEISIYAEGGTVVCYVQEEDISAVRPGMTVKCNDFEAVIDGVAQEEGKYVCTLQTEQVLSDGFYEGRIVTESVKPLSFVLN